MTMDRKKEIKEIETILKLSEEFHVLDSSTILTYKKIHYIWKNLGKMNYFNFIPKTNTYNSKDFLELAVELKGIEKSLTIKNTILGISGLYFLFMFDKRPKYLSFRTIGKFLFVGSLMFYKLLENQLIYLRIFNEIYRPELMNLKVKLEQEYNGWEKEV